MKPLILTLVLLFCLNAAAQDWPANCPAHGGHGTGSVWVGGHYQIWMVAPCDKDERRAFLAEQRAQIKAEYKAEKAAYRKAHPITVGHIARLTVMYAIIGICMGPLILIEHPE